MIRACKSLITATVVLLLFELAQSGECPPCYRDQAVLQGHGPVSATDNRRRIIVANDVPGAVNNKVTDGINGAAQKWNNARDTHSNPPNSYTTPYFVESGSFAQADFRVVSAPNTGPPARINLESYPHEIQIRSDVLANLSAADLAAMIAHEIGHRIGLANSNEEPNCPNVGATIMNGSNPFNGHRMVTTEVKSMDVFQVNRAFDDSTNMTHCQVDAPSTAGIPECMDADGDGYCFGNDCDDNLWDPTNTCSGATPTPTPTPEPECAQPGQACGIAGCCNPNENWCSGYSGVCTDCPGQLYNGICTETPIVIDVLGNGFNLTNLAGGVIFDLNAEEPAERLSWTSAGSDDAWLALDRNANGAIDNGAELFGEFTLQPDPPPGGRKNGFIALAEHDKPANGGNNDGMISSADAVFSSLRLWQDVNHNGISEASELNTLTSLGLSSIELDYKISRRVDEHGNQFRYRAKVKDAQGAQLGRWAWDVLLVAAP
jgi:hypothetical protein